MGVLSVGISQIASSSGLRIFYDGALWILVILFAFIWLGLLQAYRSPAFSVDEERIWRALKLAVSILLALPVVFSGASVISTFYNKPGPFTHDQFYRHFAMAAYFSLGMLFLLVWPLVKVVVAHRQDQ